ncbi:MAG TPA: thioredoxin family protein [Methanoregulaceae archaeon]|nr:MAG: thioredoxin family protein [Methanolinea sp.]HON81920.1 thioredoxin family protein [Methanoregulaceae archaeon]HPD10682.1 thioredoxin family protein [Methanoregulaceae archaeon]HRT15811.1 thioredoxin family protein [Methanoregulaceae archaeon]HRU31325.1 thioredoxin family protein [Methanoregulaceae archaeon]
MIRILSFFQEGCMACHEQEPINREVEKALSVPIEPLNPLKERSYIEKYSLRVTPTTLILKDGQVVERFEGVVHREQLEDAIKKYL